jgi:hypothetical protein
MSELAPAAAAAAGLLSTSLAIPWGNRWDSMQAMSDSNVVSAAKGTMFVVLGGVCEGVVAETVLSAVCWCSADNRCGSPARPLIPSLGEGVRGERANTQACFQTW